MSCTVPRDEEALTLGMWSSVESKNTVGIDVLRGVDSREELAKFLSNISLLLSSLACTVLKTKLKP